MCFLLLLLFVHLIVNNVFTLKMNFFGPKRCLAQRIVELTELIDQAQIEPNSIHDNQPMKGSKDINENFQFV